MATAASIVSVSAFARATVRSAKADSVADNRLDLLHAVEVIADLSFDECLPVPFDPFEKVGHRMREYGQALVGRVWFERLRDAGLDEGEAVADPVGLPMRTVPLVAPVHCAQDGGSLGIGAFEGSTFVDWNDGVKGTQTFDSAQAAGSYSWMRPPNRS
jgi:hypothetical protein